MAAGMNKQPLKFVEVPLNKFIEEMVPHHQKLFENHKTMVLKLISHNNTDLLQQEWKKKKRCVKQLKDLMYELDTLRTHVEDSDLDQFDMKTLSLRKIILNLVTGYGELEKKYLMLLVVAPSEPDQTQPSHPFEAVPQLQLQEDLENVKLKQQQDVLEEVEAIQRDTEDLHEMFTHLNEMVGTQKEDVQHVEEAVESTHNNIRSGLGQLIKAHKLKTAAYPLTGAFLGTIIGGPIGLVAGLKVGSLTALGCAAAGYGGGRLFKKHVQGTENVDIGSENNSNNVNENIVNDEQEKKDM